MWGVGAFVLHEHVVGWRCLSLEVLCQRCKLQSIDHRVPTTGYYTLSGALVDDWRCHVCAFTCTDRVARQIWSAIIGLAARQMCRLPCVLLYHTVDVLRGACSPRGARARARQHSGVGQVRSHGTI